MKFDTKALADLKSWKDRESLDNKEAAGVLGCGESQICRWLKGESRPCPAWRSRIRKKLKIAEDRWLTREELLQGAA
jgi:hypothetical protein